MPSFPFFEGVPEPLYDRCCCSLPFRAGEVFVGVDIRDSVLFIMEFAVEIDSYPLSLVAVVTLLRGIFNRPESLTSLSFFPDFFVGCAESLPSSDLSDCNA